MVGSTSTTKTETEGDGVFQESWLYTLADDIAVDFAEKVYSTGDSSVGINLQKKEKRYYTIKPPKILKKKKKLTSA